MGGVTDGEFVLDTSILRAFVAGVRAAIDVAASAEEACDLIRPRFAALLANPLFSLVIPPRAETLVHDHLAWGLVGTQDEEIYARHDSRLRLVERRALEPGDFYALIPRSGYVNVACEESS